MPEAGLPGPGGARFEDNDVGVAFVFGRFFYEKEGGWSFYFRFCAGFARATPAHADIGVAAERAFLHIAVADAGVEHDLAERGEIGVGLLGRADVRLGNNFDERRAAAVVVDIGLGR